MTPVDHVNRFWSSFESRGALAALDLLDDDCEWIPSPEQRDQRILRGTDEIRAYLRRLRDAGVRLEPALHTCEAVGEDVLVQGRLRVVSPGALSDSPLFWIYRLRGGRVVRVEAFASRRDALEALETLV